VFRRSELISRIGLPSVRRLVRGGQLVRYSRNVLIDRAKQFTLAARAAAALLFVGPRSVLTSHTAALLHGCSAAETTTVHVLHDSDRSDREVPRRPEIRLRHGTFADDEVVELDGLRALGLEMVIAEMLCTVHRPVALACADQALAALDPPFRDRFRAEVGKHLRTRTDLLGPRRGEVLLNLATGLPRSPAESRLLLTLHDAGLPIPALRRSGPDNTGHEHHRLDFLWEDTRIALEYASPTTTHKGTHEAAQNADHDADLRRAGWAIIHPTPVDLRDPTHLIRTLRTLFTSRRDVA
jgi:hypothetical protein